MRFSWDAGHSLHTLGKQSPDGMHEWEFNNRVVRYGMEFLSHYEGVEQLRVDDPSGQRDVPLSERAMKANSFNSIAHVSCHGNAYGTGWSDAHGIETYVQLPTLKEATALAQKVQANLIAKTGLSNRGVKYTDFQILRDTKMSAILCESGFMTNKREKDLMMADDYCSKVGSAIAEGLAAQYGLKKKVVTSATPQSSPQVQGTFRIKVKVASLWYYDRPDWNARKSTVGVNEVFTVVETLIVAGSKMYKLKSGNYITANPKYVQII